MEYSDTQNMEGMPVFAPEYGSVFKNAWKYFKKYFWWLALIGAIYFAIDLVFIVPSYYMIDASEDYFLRIFPYYFLFYFVITFIFGVVMYGIYYASLKAARNQKPKVEDLFAGFRVYWKSIRSMLLTGITICAGFMVFVIPGYYLAFRLCFVPLIVMEERVGAVDAFKKSWEMTKGNTLTIFLLALTAYGAFAVVEMIFTMIIFVNFTSITDSFLLGNIFSPPVWSLIVPYFLLMVISSLFYIFSSMLLASVYHGIKMQDPNVFTPVVDDSGPVLTE